MRFISKPYKVLVIDDDEDDYFLINEHLSDLGTGDYIVDWAPTYDEGYELLCQEKHDIYLIDYLLGAKTGLELIAQAVSIGSKRPKILLTGVGNRELDIEALRIGADDYLSKAQIDTEMTERTIRHALQRYDQHLLYEEQQARFKTLFDQSIDPIYVSDAQWNFTEANLSFLRLFGLPQTHLSAKNLSNIFQTAEGFKSFTEINKNIGFVQNYTAELVAGNDKNITALISSSPIFNFQNEIIGYQGIIHDITQLKKAEQELMMADLFSVTGRMARMIAHEVRNPLTNITLAADQLRDESMENDEEQNLYVSMIQRNSERINNLINDLLNSTKLAEPNVLEHHVENVLEEALLLCNDRINLKGIAVKKQGLDKRTPLHIDADKLKIAIINLITNSIEAMEEAQQPTLVLACQKSDDSFVISISDNGKGMNKETRENIFKAFYTSRTGGIGLGMTTVKNIIIQHKGDIKVESEPKKGTTFTILLPFQQS